MTTIRYSKFEASLNDIDTDELMEMIQRRLLESGFHRNPWDPDPNYQQTMQDLYNAIAEALIRNELVPQEVLEQATKAEDWMESTLGDDVRNLAKRLIQAGYLMSTSSGNASSVTNQAVSRGLQSSHDQTKISLTSKAIDFLGYRMYRNVLGGAGRSTVGVHETKRQATGIETIAESKPYEFGDAMNINISETLKKSAARGLKDSKLTLDYGDLEVNQATFNTSAATVVMLDCSHSMILYGEDRFTPAKQVALGLAHIIRTQFPGDEISFVLFHNSAEEIPLINLAQAQVGPYHTNTAAGLQLSQRILKRQDKEMKQIVMITDGKPSAMTFPNGQIYKNSYGLDPLVMGSTFREVGNCRRQGIQINTFMLARDQELIAFVQRVSNMTKGKAYFTSPHTVGRYVLQDFQARRTELVN